MPAMFHYHGAFSMTDGTQYAGWLTPRRLRAHGLIVGVALWSIYLWTLATPGLRDREGNLKGTDFLHFYTLGLIAREHRGPELYDMKVQSELAAAHVPQAAGIKYLPLYPPQTSILFAPLAHLSYAHALAVWWMLSAIVYFLCCYWIWRTCPNLRTHGGDSRDSAAAFPAFFHLIAWGQTSALALACFTGAYLSLRSKREFLAGIALGCLAFKPQLALAAAVIFIAAGWWKVVLGAALSGLAQFLTGVLYYGSQAFHDWLWMLRNLRSALPVSRAQNLPDALPAHLLVDADPVACTRFRLVRNHCRPRIRDRGRALAPTIDTAAGPLQLAAVRHRSDLAASDGLRLGDPRTRTDVADRLADWLSPARERKSCCRVVLRLPASPSGTISEMDARSTDGD